MTTEPININRDSHLRAGDADREEMADFLRRCHAEGRLDSDEFAARIDRCYDAKTIGQLQRLVTDLPAAPAKRASAAMQLAGLPRAIWLIPLLFAVIALSAHAGFWMLFPLLFIARTFYGSRWRSSSRARWGGYGGPDDRTL